MGTEQIYCMFERTSTCPYTGRCESFKVIDNSESWMERELHRMRQVNMLGIPLAGFPFTPQGLNWRLDHLRKVKERCYRYNGRCLRFWQFKAEDEGRLRPRWRRRPRPPVGYGEREAFEAVTRSL